MSLSYLNPLMIQHVDIFHLNLYHLSERGKAAIYDTDGILIENQKDLCDCMDEPCPGW